ncbi:hypothetical protein P43SY_006668 [Pythium insidiosum]|uniref:TRP C-terminal domain-containing protein n=1 Tax=Pythium insidiosum TaxID=114742 RepID=A0AAD5LGP7_PYTIN|nr:hypothetical protein P43SY_006668 [Pythium insidiosum]
MRPEDPDSPAPIIPRQTTTPRPTTTTPSVEEGLVSPTPSSSGMKTMGTADTPAPTEARRFNRGDDVFKQEKTDGSQTESNRVVIDPSKEVRKVIGGKDAVDAETRQMSSVEKSSYEFLQYCGSVVAVVSVALITALHFAELTGGAMTSVASPLAAPSSWEFIAFVGYIQSLSAIGHLLTRGVPAYLWKYADAMSWTVFIPFHGTKSAIGSRRLNDVAIDGLVGFADRVGVRETDLLNQCVAGFLIVLGVLVLVAAAVWVFNRWKRSQLRLENDPFSMLLQREHARGQKRLLVVAGVGVLVWLFALYPLAAVASFEIAMEVRAKEISSGPLTIACLMLLVVCFGMLALSITAIAMMRAEQDMQRPKSRLVWGSLYVDVVYDRRLFFVIPVVAQILSGVFVGAVEDQTSQLVLLLVLQLIVLASVLVLRPFVDGSLAHWLAIGITLLRVLNIALSFAFVSDGERASESRARRHIATTILAVNFAVIIVWFLRHFGVLCGLVRDRMERADADKGELNTTSALAPSSGYQYSSGSSGPGLHTQTYSSL